MKETCTVIFFMLDVFPFNKPTVSRFRIEYQEKINSPAASISTQNCSAYSE